MEILSGRSPERLQDLRSDSPLPTPERLHECRPLPDREKHRKRHNPPAALIEPFGFKRHSAHRRIMAAHDAPACISKKPSRKNIANATTRRERRATTTPTTTTTGLHKRNAPAAAEPRKRPLQPPCNKHHNTPNPASRGLPQIRGIGQILINKIKYLLCL